ncbi:hypothetical protein [Bartonella grahamii]|nr:hypothetical protein [Bartonella grahamii]
MNQPNIHHILTQKHRMRKILPELYITNQQCFTAQQDNKTV